MTECLQESGNRPPQSKFRRSEQVDVAEVKRLHIATSDGLIGMQGEGHAEFEGGRQPSEDVVIIRQLGMSSRLGAPDLERIVAGAHPQFREGTPDAADFIHGKQVDVEDRQVVVMCIRGVRCRTVAGGLLAQGLRRVGRSRCAMIHRRLVLVGHGGLLARGRSGLGRLADVKRGVPPGMRAPPE